jgi:hypothetical protein
VWRIGSEGRQRNTDLACKNQDLDSKFDVRANHRGETEWGLRAEVRGSGAMKLWWWRSRCRVFGKKSNKTENEKLKKEKEEGEREKRGKEGWMDGRPRTIAWGNGRPYKEVENSREKGASLSKRRETRFS